MAESFFIAGTVPFILAGGAHALGTLVDTVRPTFFTPIDERVVAVVDGTGIRFRAMVPGGKPERPSMWRAWLGFNISHGIGAAIFGLLLLAVALHDFDLVTEIGVIRPLSIGVSAAYFVLALRFWFYGPAILTGVGTACFVISALA
jgi:hypothetical protein